MKLESGHILLLGEVRYCRPEADGFAIGLDLEHALYNTEELARLAQRLLRGGLVLTENRAKKQIEK